MEREQSNLAPSRRRLGALLAAGAAVALPAVPALAAVVEPDAELIALGREFQEAWAAELPLWARCERERDRKSEDAAEQAFAATSEIVDRIMTLPATTLAGFRTKAHALAWTHSGEEITAQALAGKDAGECVCTDMRLIADIIRELRALG